MVTSWLKGIRVLVTGGAGFIGSHLVDALMTHGFNDKRYGEIILVLEPGVAFFPNFFSPFSSMKGVAWRISS